MSLIQAFLHEVKSDLFEESKSMSLAELSRNMLIAKGPDEELRPVNVGLLFFTQKPENYFSRCWIEGERKKAIETAIEMKKDGMPAAQIKKFTKLSIEEIEKL